MYAGFSPEFRVYQENAYTATGTETAVGGVKPLPLIGSAESILVRNGSILQRDVAFRRNPATGAVELINGTPTNNGDVFMLLNLSTWHASDTYTKREIDKKYSMGRAYFNQ